MKTHFTLTIIILLAFLSPIHGQKNRFDVLMKMQEDTLKVDSLLSYGTEIEFSKKSECLRCYQEALKIAQKLKDKSRTGRVFYRIGCELKLLDNPTEALKYLQESYKIYEGLKNYRKLVQISHKMAQVFEDVKNIPSAMKYFQQTLSLAIEHNQIDYQAFALGSMAGIQGNQFKDYKQAEANLKKAIILCKKIKDEFGSQSFLFDLSGIYQRQKFYDKALTILSNCHSFYQKEHYILGQAMCYEKSGEIYFEEKDYKQSIKKLQDGLSLLEKEEGNLGEKISLTNLLSKVYAAQNDFKQAFNTQQKWKSLYDTLSLEKNKNNIDNLQIKFETSQKEFQIKTLNRESQNQKRQIIFAIIGLCLLATLLFLSLYLYVNLRKKNSKIVEQANQLRLLMSELHHRVKNNLAVISSMLTMHAYRVEDENVKKAISEGQMRVQAMSMIHQRLYKSNDVSSVNIQQYITDLSENLIHAYGFSKNNFDLKIEVVNPKFDIDLAIPIGLIINEIITNALKYAYENIKRPSLSISVANEKDISIVIKDNGNGIDSDSFGSKDTFGKKLITTLSKQLRGSFKLYNNNGTSFELTIPYTGEF